MQLLRSAGRSLAVVMFLGSVMGGALSAQTAEATASRAEGMSPGVAGVAAVPARAKLRPVLLELFTSEGCSSCPPADELLGKLQGTKTESGQLVIALSEHVTYWNQGGWSDPFSSEVFSERQNSYGERFGMDEVYTPQIVVNGNQAVSGNDAAAIRRAMLTEFYRKPAEGIANRTDPEMLHLVSVQPWMSPEAKIHAKAASVPRYLIVTVTMTQPLTPGADVYAVVADDVDTLQVLRGENAGRSLRHVAVARNLIRLPKPNGVGTTTMMVPLPATAGQSQHLVLFVQAAEQGSVLGAVSVPVPAGFPQNASVR